MQQPEQLFAQAAGVLYNKNKPVVMKWINFLDKIYAQIVDDVPEVLRSKYETWNKEATEATFENTPENALEVMQLTMMFLFGSTAAISDNIDNIEPRLQAVHSIINKLLQPENLADIKEMMSKTIERKDVFVTILNNTGNALSN